MKYKGRKKLDWGGKYQSYKEQYQKKLRQGESMGPMLDYDAFVEISKVRKDKYKDLLKRAGTEEDKALYRNKLKNITRSILESQFGKRETTNKRIEMVESLYNNRFEMSDEELSEIWNDDRKAAAYSEFLNTINEEGISKRNVLTLFSLIHEFTEDPEQYWY